MNKVERKIVIINCKIGVGVPKDVRYWGINATTIIAAKKMMNAEIKIRITDLFNKTNLISLIWI